MIINEYIQILGAIILTLLTVGLGACITFAIVLMWSVIKDEWHD